MKIKHFFFFFILCCTFVGKDLFQFFFFFKARHSQIIPPISIQRFVFLYLSLCTYSPVFRISNAFIPEDSSSCFSFISANHFCMRLYRPKATWRVVYDLLLASQLTQISSQFRTASVSIGVIDILCCFCYICCFLFFIIWVDVKQVFRLCELNESINDGVCICISIYKSEYMFIHG